MNNEVWKDIKGYEGLYQVSNFGRVQSLNYRRTNKNRILKQSMNNGGYLCINLYRNSILKSFLVHRLVAMAFIPNPNNLPQINHKDESTTNNNVENLEWCDAKYNCNYGHHIERNKEKRFKPVLQYTLDGKFVKEWKSIRDAELTLSYSSGKISKCANGKNKTSYNYIWKFKN